MRNIDLHTEKKAEGVAALGMFRAIRRPLGNVDTDNPRYSVELRLADGSSPVMTAYCVSGGQCDELIRIFMSE
jgi:hypothetical protein